MKLKSLALAAAAVSALAGTAPAFAQAKEQFIPVLSYRTGAYAPNGAPWANGFVDYLKLVNARGGLNGVKLSFEECETGYDTARSVECYERLKCKGASFVQPLSTGATFAITEKAPADKIPVLTIGYGRSESADGTVFKWNFPIAGTYWVASDAIVQAIGKKEGGLDKLKGKKIALVYHDSPYGKEPIALLTERAKLHGFETMFLPVTHPGVEQKATWLQIRQNRPDYVLLWGWGVMNSTAIKEAVAVNYPRDKMYGVWWAGAEPDVLPAGDGAKGYNALALHPAGANFPVHQAMFKNVYDKNKGAGKREEVGQVLYNRGLIDGMLLVEAIKTAQAKFGKKPMNGEQIRWGFENLKLTAQHLKELGFEGLISPISVSCQDHSGVHRARIQQWDGSKWSFTSDWIDADYKYMRPKIEQSATEYGKQKNLPTRDCSKES
jgi:branched-chain amino acid transport system substrate-binding protein